ncbi:MAG: hypothetical protein C5B59_19190 [Bacteroidetes bacterium]|nr:MAG: hypothetical protein C5B59_19190 [Bacteroidota bacterium]
MPEKDLVEEITPIENAYIFEKVNSSHYPLLQELFLDVFNLNYSIADIERRFNTNELGLETIGFIAISRGKPEAAAYYGVFPLKCQIGNEIILAAQSGDTMTHSHHRKKGLFSRLAIMTYDECKKKGIRLIYGFPNDNSYHGSIKVGWNHTDDVVRYDLKLKIKTFPLPKIALGYRLLRRIYLRYARFLLSSKLEFPIPGFFSSISNQPGRVYRDSTYIKYKYADDKFFLRFGNVVVWLKVSDTLSIGDFENTDLVNYQVLKKIKKIAFFLGHNTIAFTISKGAPKPSFLNHFKEHKRTPTLMLYLDSKLEGTDISFTAADFDTW